MSKATQHEGSDYEARVWRRAEELARDDNPGAQLGQDGAIVAKYYRMARLAVKWEAEAARRFYQKGVHAERSRWNDIANSEIVRMLPRSVQRDFEDRPELDLEEILINTGFIPSPNQSGQEAGDK